MRENTHKEQSTICSKQCSARKKRVSDLTRLGLQRLAQGQRGALQGPGLGHGGQQAQGQRLAVARGALALLRQEHGMEPEAQVWPKR